MSEPFAAWVGGDSPAPEGRDGRWAACRSLFGALVAGVYDGAPSSTEARRLCLALLGSFTALERDGRAGGASVEQRLEEVLRVVGEATGEPYKPSVQRAKQLLREAGYPGLASRVGALSKGRNTSAHPDDFLVQDIHRALGNGAGLVLTRSEAAFGDIHDTLMLTNVAHSGCSGVCH